MERTQEEKLKDIHQLKTIISTFIEKYYCDDVVKIEIHKNSNMKNISFKIFPMSSIERF